MALRSSLNLSGSLLALESKNATNRCSLWHPLSVKHQCHCKFWLQSEAQLKLLSSGSHISWNGLYSSNKKPKHQKEFDGFSGNKIHDSTFQDDGINLENFYEKQIRQEPANPMLFRNYAHYLCEFKGNLVGAEKCYLLAISLDPHNGPYLAEYAFIAWELHFDETLATHYMERALIASASPEDRYVLDLCVRLNRHMDHL